MKIAEFSVFCMIFGVYFETALSANILYISPTPSPSHNIWDKTVAMALRQKGHQITYVSPFEKESMENFTSIYLEGIFEEITKQFDFNEMIHSSSFVGPKLIYDYALFLCEHSEKTRGMQQLIEISQQNVHFDLIILDTTVGECFYPFVEKFHSPPVVATSAFGISPVHVHMFGNSLDASFIPFFWLKYSEEMSFYERVNNYCHAILFQFWRSYIYMPKIWKRGQKMFGKDIIPYDEIDRNISFLLSNYDPGLDYPRSVPPAIIPVGGLHTRRAKSLPQDLKLILDQAKDGVILFSLGSNLRSDLLHKDKLQELLKAFAQLKQTVVWKFETEINSLPKNVVVRPWLPQNDILAHSNVKIFITHGGLLSTQEAMYHGVPVIGIPFYTDQHTNMYKMQSRKVGLTLDYLTLTSESVLKCIEEILQNPVYRESIQKLSRRYRDQPQDALTRAVFWIEYTIRHGGAHLRVASRDMPFYQVMYLDIWAFVLFIVISVIVIVRKLYSSFFKLGTKSKLKGA